MDDNSIVSFFNSVLEDDLEKKIIQLIANGLEPNEIIEELIKSKIQEETK